MTGSWGQLYCGADRCAHQRACPKHPIQYASRRAAPLALQWPLRLLPSMRVHLRCHVRPHRVQSSPGPSPGMVSAIRRKSSSLNFSGSSSWSSFSNCSGSSCFPASFTPDKASHDGAADCARAAGVEVGKWIGSLDGAGTGSPDMVAPFEASAAGVPSAGCGCGNWSCAGATG